MNSWTIAEFLGSATTGAFLLTIVYVHGYSLVLGTNLLTYFTVEDSLKLSVAWLAPTAIYFALIVFPSEFLEGLSRGRAVPPNASARATKRSRLGGDL